ncbi:MAG TPA: outer membrane beta-barrel protein [Thiobacillus sp.]
MTKLKKLTLAASLASIASLGTNAAFAADEHEHKGGEPVMAEKPAVPSIGAVMEATGIDIHGYVDASYTALSGNGKFINGVNNRVFDYERNSFNIQALDLTVSKLPTEGFGGLVNLTAGKDADVIASYDTDGLWNSQKDNFDVTQAYFHYATGPWMVIAGKYVTLAGAEVIKSPSNTNFSRSILFGYAIPFAHTGVRTFYKASDTLTLIAGVNNGWDVLKDTNSNKTVELGASFAPSKMFALAAQAYSGTERVAGFVSSGTQGRRDLIDLVATFNATDQLAFVLNFDYGAQKNATLIDGSTGTAKWIGWAGYINYQISDKWRTSLRGEYFDDQDGYRSAVGAGETSGQKWKEATLTLAYLPNEHVELRAEVRGDWSDQSVFLDSNGVTSGKDQQSFGLEAIYKF